jgi:hypothetical protein
MNLRFTIGLCAVVIGVFSVSLCQPPTPRIAKGEGPADVVVSPNQRYDAGHPDTELMMEPTGHASVAGGCTADHDVPL